MEYVGEAEIKVEMQQNLGLKSQDMIVIDARVTSGEYLRFRNNNFLIFGSNEKRSDGLQRWQTSGKLSSKCHTVVDAEREKDGFHFETVPFGKVKYEVQVANACILVKTSSVEEERRRETRLLLKQVVINARQIHGHIPRLTITTLLGSSIITRTQLWELNGP